MAHSDPPATSPDSVTRRTTRARRVHDADGPAILVQEVEGEQWLLMSEATFNDRYTYGDPRHPWRALSEAGRVLVQDGEWHRYSRHDAVEAQRAFLALLPKARFVTLLTPRSHQPLSSESPSLAQTPREVQANTLVEDLLAHVDTVQRDLQFLGLRPSQVLHYLRWRLPTNLTGLDPVALDRYNAAVQTLATKPLAERVRTGPARRRSTRKEQGASA